MSDGAVLQPMAGPLEGRRILVLAPHPDDEVVGACAAIGRARAAGARVFTAFLSNGVPAEAVLWPWDRPARAARVTRRWREATTVASLIGTIPVLEVDEPTRTLEQRLDECFLALERAAREHCCDCVWAPAYEGGHADHDCTSFLGARLAAALALEAHEFAEYNLCGGRLLRNRFPDAADTERVLELDAREVVFKRKALKLYASERFNLRLAGLSRECFRPLAARRYDRPPHPGRLLYQRFQWVPGHPRIDYTRPEDLMAAFARFDARRRPDEGR